MGRFLDRINIGVILGKCLGNIGWRLPGKMPGVKVLGLEG